MTDDDIEAVARVLRSGWISTGDECALLEEALCAVTGAPHAVAVSSCTAALEIAFRTLRLPRGSRVGVPTWTYVATATAALATGLEPVLLDVDPLTLDLAPAAVAAEIDDLAALAVVHFAGRPVDRRVLDDAAAAGVPVVEDAAHALGAVDHRGPVSGAGTVGACFSFYATKNITSSEGGAFVTHDPERAHMARSQRMHGLDGDAWDRYRLGAANHYELLEPGLKANLPDTLAALARSQLARLDLVQATRRALLDLYRDRLDEVADVILVPGTRDERSADHLAVVLLPAGVDRRRVMVEMAARGVATAVHFPPLHRMRWFRENVAVGRAGVSGAESVADRALSLPLHPGLDADDVDHVVSALGAAVAPRR